MEMDSVAVAAVAVEAPQVKGGSLLAAAAAASRSSSSFPSV